jgi:hypothetical protein
MTSLARRALPIGTLMVFFAASPVCAELLVLGDGTVLDRALGVAFLQDLNTAQTTGYDPDGRMSWFETMAWIDHLNATRYLGYSDWELASGSGRGGGYPPRTEANYLEHLVFAELGNTRPAPGSSLEASDLALGPFFNLGSALSAGYWIWPELAYDGELDPACGGSPGGSCFAYSYRILDDRYDGDPATYSYYATAMRRSVNVPEPNSIVLLLAGICTALLSRRLR